MNQNLNEQYPKRIYSSTEEAQTFWMKTNSPKN